MALTESARRINQNTAAVYSATLEDDDGTPISYTLINTITLLYYDLASGTIINSRNVQDVLNTNNVTINTLGVLEWIVQPADATILDTTLLRGQYETHIAVFDFFWSAGTLRGRHEVQLDILALTDVPPYSGVTIISSWGGGTSNSYLAYTHANSLIMNCMLSNSAWTDATPQQRAASLIQATQDIDSKQYLYTKYVSTQILEFPRRLNVGWPQSLMTWNSTSLSGLETRMQQDVEYACAHQALFLLRQNTNKKFSDFRDQGISAFRKKIGPIEEEYKFGSTRDEESRPGSKTGRLCSEALSYLSDWLATRAIVRG